MPNTKFKLWMEDAPGTGFFEVTGLEHVAGLDETAPAPGVGTRGISDLEILRSGEADAIHDRLMDALRKGKKCSFRLVVPDGSKQGVFDGFVRRGGGIAQPGRFWFSPTGVLAVQRL